MPPGPLVRIEVKCPICAGRGWLQGEEKRGECPFCVGAGSVWLEPVRDPAQPEEPPPVTDPPA